MNALKRLGTTLAKNGDQIIEGTKELDQISVKYFLGNTRVSNNEKSLISISSNKSRLNFNQLIKDNAHLIGKGSQYQRKVVKHYLSPLIGHKLRRQDIHNDYNKQLSHTDHIITPTDRKREAFSSMELAVDILPLLIKSTKKPVTKPAKRRLFKPYYTKEVPPIPDFKGDMKLFEDYIALLTHTKFLYKNSSSSNGIIPKILRVLIHPSNLNTIDLRSVQCYNDILYFYSKKYDFATCRELFAQMKVEGCKPNTTTYNILLLNLVKKVHMRKIRSIKNELLFYLRNMQKNGIFCDTVTWNTCYNFLNDEMSRDLYIEKLIDCGVPLTSELVYSVVRNSSKAHISTKTKYILDMFGEDGESFVNLKFVNLLISDLVLDHNVERAWSVLRYFELKQLKFVNQPKFLINSETMNTFLRYFAEQGRIDLCFLTYNYFVKDLVGPNKIRPNVNTFDMLMKSLVKNGYTETLPTVFEVICALSERYGIKIRNDGYWSLKCKAIIKFQYKSSSCEKNKTELLNKLNNFSWGKQLPLFTTKVWKNGNSEVRKICRMLGSIPIPLRKSRKLGDKETVDRSQNRSVSEKKKAYRNRIKYIAIGNAMASRIPYANNWHQSFKDEVTKRGLLASER